MTPETHHPSPPPPDGGERSVTLREHGGASVLVGNNVERIRKEYETTLKLKRTPRRPELWHGQTAMRCVEAIVNYVPK